MLQVLVAGRECWDVGLLFWPRLFLSGREAQVARRLAGISRIYAPAAALAALVGEHLRRRVAGRPGVVLHLGGSARLSLRLGRRLGLPVVAYSERPETLPAGFDLVCGSDGSARARTHARIIGNLLVDSVADLREQRRRDRQEGQVVGLLPGSRDLQLRQYLPHIAPVVEAVSRRLPGVRFVIARSPLVSDRMLLRALGRRAGAGLESTADGLVLCVGAGVCIPLLEREQVLAEADLLISTPGTNTGEAAALGIPHMVVAPIDPSLPLFRGLPGLVERSRWPGRPLKRWLLRRLTGGVRYYAQANLRAGRELVPELQGPLDLRRVVEQVMELLGDAPLRARISRELTGIMGPPGAAERLARELERQIRREPPQETYASIIPCEPGPEDRG